jgi:hypothetical protein
MTTRTTSSLPSDGVLVVLVLVLVLVVVVVVVGEVLRDPC